MSEYTSNKYICMYVSLQSSCINYCLLFSILCFRSRCVSFSAAICVLLSVRPSVCLSHSPAVAVALQLLLCCSGCCCCCCNNNNNIYAIHKPCVCLHFVVSSNQTQVIYICIYFTCAQRTKKSSKQKIKELINADAKHTHRHTRTRTQGQRRRAMGCSATKIGSSRQQWQ